MKNKLIIGLGLTFGFLITYFFLQLAFAGVVEQPLIVPQKRDCQPIAGLNWTLDLCKGLVISEAISEAYPEAPPTVAEQMDYNKARIDAERSGVCKLYPNLSLEDCLNSMADIATRDPLD
jgi:hypothetical protein